MSRYEKIVLWDILFGLLILGTNYYGDYITDKCPQAGYACPDICDVDHKHLPLKECNNGKTEEGRASKTAIQVIKQLDEKAVGIRQSEGI